MSWEWRTWTGGTYTVRERGDDATRIVTTWPGGVPTTRPYTVAENAKADADAVLAVQASNEQTIRSRATAALTANDNFLLIASPGAGQVATQTRQLTKECSAVIRLLLGQLDTTNGT